MLGDVKIPLKLHKGLLYGQRGELGQVGGVEDALHAFHDQLAHALNGFEKDVARKAVGHQHVAGVESDGIGLDVAHKADIFLCREELICLSLGGRTLMALGAVIEQANARVLKTIHGAHIGHAHISKLQKKLGLDGDVCAGVQEQDGGLEGEHGTDGGTVHALEAAHRQGCACEESAGVARRDESVTASLCERPQAHAHGGVLLFLENGHGVVLHGDDSLGMKKLKARKVQPCLSGDGLQARMVTHQEVVASQLAACVHSALEHLQGRVISAHAVNDKFHSQISFEFRFKCLFFCSGIRAWHGSLPAPPARGRRTPRSGRSYRP